MTSSLPEGRTFFAPAGRAEAATLAEQVQACVEGPLGAGLLETLEAQVMIMNVQRQVLAVSPSLLEALDLGAAWNPGAGKRPGELLGCVHAQEGPDGCGTAKDCRGCGAVLAILGAQSGASPAEGECLLSMRQEGKWVCGEYRVKAAPLSVAGHDFVVLSLRDISAQKRREALEHCFLHDLANSLQGLRGWAELLELHLREPQEVAQGILRLSDHLAAEIQAQRLLLQAEEGNLVVSSSTFSVKELLDELREAVGRHRCMRGREFILPEPGPELALRSDRTLVLRVVENMAINALEATEPGGRVEFRFEAALGGPAFTCHNAGVIPPEVAGRIFQRSFSTKATQGRGLGTYGMKLLGENFLHGKVDFHTQVEQGTTFCFHLPPSALVRLGH